MNFKDLFRKKRAAPPLVHEDMECAPPSEQRVKRRIMVLWANSARSYAEEVHQENTDLWGERIGDLNKWLFTHLADDLTAREAQLHPAPLGTWAEHDMLQYSWDQEATVPLRWALGLLPQMPNWDERLDGDFDFASLPQPDAWEPLARLRPRGEVETQAMIVETAYWRLRNHLLHPDQGPYARKLMGRAAKLGHIRLDPTGDLARTDGSSAIQASQAELSSLISPLTERLQGLNWLAGHDSDWDEITCDSIVGWLWDDKWPEA